MEENMIKKNLTVFSLLIIAGAILLTGCDKKKNNTDGSSETGKKNNIYYSIQSWNLSYKEETDAGKSWNEMKTKKQKAIAETY